MANILLQKPTTTKTLQQQAAEANAPLYGGVFDTRGFRGAGASGSWDAPTTSTTAPVVDNSAAIAAAALSKAASPLLASLDSLNIILGNKNQQTRDEYDRVIKGYDDQDALDLAAKNENVVQNEQSLTANNQAALLNAANGSTGLRGVLASLGGLAGSGIDVIKRLVGLAANSDTGAARKTFETNASGINTSWAQAERGQRQRRDDAVAIRDNNLQNNEAQVLNSRQGIFQQLANLYGTGTAQGNEYAGKAGALAAPIAATTKASVAPYATASSLFSPGALQTYLAGTQNLNVSTTGDSTTPINSPIYSTKKKDQLAGVA